jgi:hypothetical protein
MPRIDGASGGYVPTTHDGDDVHQSSSTPAGESGAPAPHDGVDPPHEDKGFFGGLIAGGKDIYESRKVELNIIKDFIVLGKDVVTGNLPAIPGDVKTLLDDVAKVPPEDRPNDPPPDFGAQVDGSQDYNKIDKEDQELIDGDHPNTTYKPDERYT